MTPLQKKIANLLIEGGSIVGNSKYGYRVRDAQHNVKYKFRFSTFYYFKDLLRPRKGMLVLNRTKVRQLHGNTYLKQLYQKQMLEPA
jgi:hypothetical protein